MSLLVEDCPRCGTRDITFDVGNQVQVATRVNWQMILEIFCVCRACRHPTIFLVTQSRHYYEDLIKAGLSNVGSAINDIVNVERHIGIQDNSAEPPPEHLPEDIKRIFKEGSACMSIGCYNAATTMFRLCLDLATKSLLPEDAEGLNNRVRRNLGVRLPWLFDNQILPDGLREFVFLHQR